MSLVQMSLSAALMIVAIIILRALTIERFPKKTFLVLWWIVLLRLLIPFSIPSVMSIYSWISPDVPKAVHQEVQEITESQSTSEPVLEIPSEVLQNASPQEDTVSAVPEQTRSEVVKNSTQFEMTPIPDTDIEYVEVKPRKSFSEIFFDMLPVIWGVGIGVIAAFFGINYWRGIREFRMSLPVENEFVNEWLSSHQLRRNITIRQYDCIHTPLTYGIFRPVILLPKESLKQSPSTLNFILTHEWVHIRRFDCVTKILLTAALCIHWMNPLVWVMYLLFNRDIELSCDETVLHLLGRNRRSDYALALIDMEEQKSGFASFASGFGRNAIEERIRAIMKMKKASLITILAAVVVVACVSILFATSAKNNPTESPSASEESSSNPVMKGTDGVYREINLEDYKQYESYGMTYNKEKNLFYYENKPVRFFYDSGSGNSFTDYYEGEVDVEATRDKDNKLTGLHYSSQEDSERRTKEIEQMDSSVTASENSDTIYSPLPSSGFSKDDKTSENVLASYQKYGISYNKDNDTWFYQNKPVRALLDRYNGNTFFSGNGEINLKAIYDDNGNFQKIEVLTDKQMEQELSSNSVKKNTSLTERFAELEKYGVMFVPSETDSTKGDLYYNGELVKYFADPNPSGNFTFFSETEGSNLTLYITYNEDGTLKKLNTTTEDTLNLYPYPDGPLRISECQDLTEYFESFGRHQLIFQPSPADSNSGNLYMRDGTLVSTFYDYRENPCFVFRSQDTSGNWSIAYDGSGFQMSGGGILPNLFSFEDEGIVYDETKQSWTYHGKTIHWVIDGNFAKSINPEGEINIRATYQDGLLQPLEEISIEEATKLAMELLKPDTFASPVKETVKIEDIEGRRLYYAPEGSEVTCSISGTVFYAGWKDGYGYCVQIADPQGIIWTYSHLKEISVKYGQNISVGDKIGTVGHSGSATDFYLGLDAVSNEEMLDISQLLAE